jgi:hypothetical protein
MEDRGLEIKLMPMVILLAKKEMDDNGELIFPSTPPEEECPR